MQKSYFLLYPFLLLALWMGTILFTDPAIASDSMHGAWQEVEPTPTSSALSVEADPPTLVDLAIGHELIEDSDNNGEISPGDTVRYSTNISNTGQITATDLTLIYAYDAARIRPTDEIEGSGTDVGGQVTWSLNPIPPNSAIVLQINVMLLDFPSGATQVPMNFRLADNETVLDTFEHALTVVAQPRLTIQTSAAPEPIRDLDGNGVAGPGDTLRYLVEVENRGNAAAQNVRITSHYDETLVESVTNIARDGQEDDNSVVWVVDTLAPDESIQLSYDATFTTIFPLGTVNILQRSTATSKEVTELTDETAFAVTIAPQLELSVAHSPVPIQDLNDNGVADPGDTVQIQLTVGNRGNAAAQNIRLVGDYNESMVASIVKVDRNGQVGTGEITWSIGEIAPGGTETFNFDMLLNSSFPAGESTMRTVGILIYGDDEPLQSEQALIITAQPMLEVSIGKVPGLINDLNSNGEADPGDTVGYQIVYANRGNAIAHNVEIATLYNHNLIRTIEHVVGDGVEEGNGIRWRIATLEPESEGLFSYQATLAKVFPAGESTVTNKATIGRDGETAQSDEHGIRVTAIPNLKIDTESVADLLQDLNGNGKADPGDTLRYKVTYQNQGTAAASDVVIVADYAEALVGGLANITPSTATDDGDKLKWTLSEPVAPGVESTFTYDVRLKQEMPEATTAIQHLVSILSLEQEPVSNSTLLTLESPSVAEDDFGRGLFAGNTNTLSALVGLLVIVALAVLTYVGAIAKPKATMKDEDSKAYELARISLVREGVFLTFIIASILILALGEGIKEDGAISILSAIVGYVFGRVSSSG